MTARQLIKPYQEYLSQIPNVNHGGCAYVALELHKFFTSKGYKPQIIFMHDEYDDEAANNIRNNKPDSCGHAIVRVGKLYFDAGTITKRDKRAYRYDFLLPISPELAQLSISKGYGWNPSFDRRQVRTIKRILTTA